MTPSQVRDAAASPTEEAYGILWRQVTDNKQIHLARKLLLSLIDVAGQRRGINAAVKQFGPVNPYEIAGLADWESPADPPQLPNGLIEDMAKALGPFAKAWNDALAQFPNGGTMAVVGIVAGNSVSAAHYRQARVVLDRYAAQKGKTVALGDVKEGS